LWEVSSRVNTGGSFNLNEEERLTLVARTLEVARQSDEEGQLMIRIEDPWDRICPLESIGFLQFSLSTRCFGAEWAFRESIWKSRSVTEHEEVRRETCWTFPACLTNGARWKFR